MTDNQRIADMDEPRTTWHIGISRWGNHIHLGPLANATEDEAERHVHETAAQLAALGMDVTVTWDADPYGSCVLKGGWVESKDFSPVGVAS